MKIGLISPNQANQFKKVVFLEKSKGIPQFPLDIL